MKNGTTGRGPRDIFVDMSRCYDDNLEQVIYDHEVNLYKIGIIVNYETSIGKMDRESRNSKLRYEEAMQ